LHQNRVDFPELWHCIIASLHQNRVDFPGRTNNFNELQIVANAKKPRGPEDIRRGARRLHEHGAHGFRLGAWCRSRDCTHHRTAVIIIGSSRAGLRPEEREMDKDKDIITAPAAGGGSY
jgi:hypothetical protein